MDRLQRSSRRYRIRSGTTIEDFHHLADGGKKQQIYTV